jgi:alpha-galactosidase
MQKIILLILVLAVKIPLFCQESKYQPNYAKFENLAMTPPMGWNSWNKFQCNVDENLIKETADAIVLSDMKDLGYVYINIDDCWYGDRDSLGFIHPDPKRFPSGMKALADYIHAKGLKFGIYSDAGAMTCGKKPGSRGYEYQDALTYAQWGVDYLKYDWCFTEGLKGEGAYKTMSAALRKAGRPVVLSICEWGTDKPWEWGPKVGHLWRTTGDIADCFECVVDYGNFKTYGMIQNIDKQVELRKYAGPGHWNDPDMLEIGNGGMTFEEEKTNFSMWAMLSAPLIAGNDIRSMSKETKEILMNKDVITVNQDELGIQALKHSTKDSVETWIKPLKNGKWAICWLNRSKISKKIDFNWKQNILKDDFSKRDLNANIKTYQLKNLWSKKMLGTTEQPLKAEIPSHGSLMVLLE